MDNLNAAGLTLRTLRLKDLDDLLADLNYNFTQIVSLPAFKGQPGNDGQSIIGPQGERGSLWAFISAQRFIDEYALITTGSQITISFLNAELTNDQARLYDTIGFGDSEQLQDNDIMVLPSGQIVQLQTDVENPPGNLLQPQFIDTGITFAQVSGITEERVIEIVQSILGPPSATDSIYRLYNPLAKNSSDDTPGNNAVTNADSAIDIDVVVSGPGVVLNDHFFYAPIESYVNPAARISMLVGSAEKYHDIIQGTQTNLTNDYLPGVNDWNALAVLQNSYANGITIGHRDSTTYRNFARLYRTTNAFKITSSYSPNIAEYSELTLSDSAITARSTTKFAFDTAKIEGLIPVEVDFGYLYINKSTSTINIGNTGVTTTVAGNRMVVSASNGLRVTTLANAAFLGTNASGDFIPTSISILQTTNGTSATSLVSQNAINDSLNAQQVEIDTNTASINQNAADIQANTFEIQSNSNAVDSLFGNAFLKDGVVLIESQATDFNNLVESNFRVTISTIANAPIGTTTKYIVTILRADNFIVQVATAVLSGKSYKRYSRNAGGTWFPWQNEADTRKAGEIVMISSTTLQNFDLNTGLGLNDWAGWALCDGRNSTDDYRGRVPVGFIASAYTTGTTENDVLYQTAGNIGGEKTVALIPEQTPVKEHSHDIKRKYVLVDLSNLSIGSTALLTNEPPDFFFTDTSQVENAEDTSATAHENRQPFIVVPYVQKLI